MSFLGIAEPMAKAVVSGTSTVPFGPFLFSPEVKASDLLTPLTILISVMTFAWTFRKDIEAKRSTEADKIRGAAARTLGKLDRWRELAFWYYRDVQPSFVETSGLLAEKFDVASARDHLWTALTSARIKSQERLLSEGLETAYVELSSYYPGIYDAFRMTIQQMKTAEESAYNGFIEIAQRAVLSYDGKEKGYVPPKLGNDLRRCSSIVNSYLTAQLDLIWETIHQFLIDVIKQNDPTLLNSKRKGTPIQYQLAREISLDDFLKANRPRPAGESLLDVN